MDGSQDRARGLGWRAEFGEAWTHLAIGAVSERRATPEEVWVLRAVRRSTRYLQTVIDRPADPAADREAALCAAALALEAATAARHPRRAADEALRLALLESMERVLDFHERDVLCAHRGYRISSDDVRRAGGHADRAALQLRAHPQQPAPYLVDLDQCAVDLAAIAVRVAVNLAKFNSAIGPARTLPQPWCRRLTTTVEHIERATSRLRNGPRAQLTSRGWARAALDLRRPARDIDTARDPACDPTIGAEALTALRAHWIRRAAYELRVVDPLRPFAPDRNLRQRRTHEIAAHAGAALINSQLIHRADAFDHGGAWAASDQCLTEALAAGTSRRSWPTAPPDHLRRMAITNAARATLAASLIDARLHDHPTQPH
jgi:hypothetical protein